MKKEARRREREREADEIMQVEDEAAYETLELPPLPPVDYEMPSNADEVEPDLKLKKGKKNKKDKRHHDEALQGCSKWKAPDYLICYPGCLWLQEQGHAT